MDQAPEGSQAMTRPSWRANHGAFIRRLAGETQSMVRGRHLACHERVLGLAPALLHPATTARRISAHVSRHVSREAGINISSLQRQFQASQGMTLFEYQRVRKLKQAREALERDGISVTEAAWRAGYGSAANFATAFKRQYGLTPRQVRSELWKSRPPWIRAGIPSPRAARRGPAEICNYF